MSPFLTPRERLSAAQRFIAERRLDEGEAVLLDLLREAPNQADALCALGGVALARRDGERAMAILGAAATAYPGHHGLAVNLGLAYQSAGSLDEAVLCLERAQGLAPDDPEVRLALAHARFSRGDLEAARAAVEVVLARDGDHAGGQALLGAIAMATGEDAWAEHAFQRALAGEPNDADSLQRLSVLCLRRGEDAEALALAERAKLAAPLDLGKSVHHAFALASAGRFREAQEACRRILVVAPAHTGASEILARALVAGGEAEAGIAELSQRVRAAPQDVPLLLALVGVLRLAGRFEQALAFLDHAARLAPGDERIADLTGETRLALGRFPQKIERAAPLPSRIVVPARMPSSELILFARLLPRLQREGDPVTVFCADLARHVLDHLAAPVALAPLEEAGDATPLPVLLSLLGVNAEDVAETRPYLTPERGRRETWLAALGEHGRPAVGVVWTASALGPAMADLASALPDHVTPVSLVFDAARHDLADWPAAIDAGVHLAEPAELIAALSCLDAVVGPDGPILHLAGALGLPGVVLVPPGPAWPWSARNGRSIWYSAIAVARQPVFGHWDEAAAQARSVVESLFPP